MDVDELRDQLDAPEKLSDEYLHDRLDRLADWRDDANEMMRESTDWQEELEQLAITMTEEERRATHELFATVAKQLIGIARRQHQSESPPDLELSDVTGILYPVFLRCLVDYDPEKAHLTTHIRIRAREHIRRYIRKSRKSRAAGNSERMRRLRKIAWQEDNAKMAAEGRRATLDELVAVAAERAFVSSEATLRERFRDIRKERPAHSLDERVGDSANGRTLGQMVESDSPTSRPGVRAIGKRVAELAGKEDLWSVLVDSETGES
jgi:hypothetical protein